jgi:hypothetical protein
LRVVRRKHRTISASGGVWYGALVKISNEHHSMKLANFLSGPKWKTISFSRRSLLHGVC